MNNNETGGNERMRCSSLRTMDYKSANSWLESIRSWITSVCIDRNLSLYFVKRLHNGDSRWTNFHRDINLITRRFLFVSEKCTVLDVRATLVAFQSWKRNSTAYWIGKRRKIVIQQVEKFLYRVTVGKQNYKRAVSFEIVIIGKTFFIRNFCNRRRFVC